MAGLRTEFPFTLPKGFVDAEGNVHRNGTMRLATARDELEPLNDPKVRDADDPNLTIIVLARVITQLGSIERLSPRDIEGLFAADLAYLQDVYATINYGSDTEVARHLEQVRAARTPRPAHLAGDADAPARTPLVGAAPAAAPAAPEAPADADAATGPDADGPPTDEPPTDQAEEELEVVTRAPRRSRIEEVGRSSGRPGGR